MQPADSASQEKERVRSFWQEGPCGSVHAEAFEGTTEYFAQVERKRFELEPFIERYANFDEARDSDVLEIGVGLGTDFIRFARAGARVTGLDLTERSVTLVQRRLELEALEGRVLVGDAESLPFESGSFDFVYSWGVLHHTPDTLGAIREAMRVLRPGGRLCVMLYHRRSWVAFGMWVSHALLAGHPFRSVADVLASHMESAGTKAYTPGELVGAFTGLRNLRIERVGTPYDRHFAGPLADRTGPWLGWFMVIRGQR